MLTEKQIQAMRAENDLLQLQLEDVNAMITVREEELDLLRTRAGEAAAMQSRLDCNLDEFEQMQRTLGNFQQKNSGSLQRLELMEDELYIAVKEQLKYAESLSELNSLEANLRDTNNELQEAASVFVKLTNMKSKLATSESNLEIARMQIENLQAELAEVRAYNALLLQKKLG